MMKTAFESDFQSLFFYHFQKALNAFWQTQHFENQYDDLVDKVFLIAEEKNQFWFYLILSDTHIQIYPKYQEREVDVKIVFSQKELMDAIIQGASKKFNSRHNEGGKSTEKEAKILPNLKIYGDAHLAQKLMELFKELDFDFMPYLELLTPKPIAALIHQLKIDQIVGSILGQIIGTLENLRASSTKDSVYTTQSASEPNSKQVDQ